MEQMIASTELSRHTWMWFKRFKFFFCKNKLQWKCNRNKTIFKKKISLKMPSPKWQPFCLGIIFLIGIVPSNSSSLVFWFRFSSNSINGLSHKPHNAPVPYLAMHHFGTEIWTFLFQSDMIWDMLLVHCGNFHDWSFVVIRQNLINVLLALNLTQNSRKLLSHVCATLVVEAGFWLAVFFLLGCWLQQPNYARAPVYPYGAPQVRFGETLASCAQQGLAFWK